ncbi:hypothetical protein ABZ360_26835 [Streptomyces althioticus]
MMQTIRVPRPGPTRPRHRRQGLQRQGHTHLAAATRHPAHHPGTVRPQLATGSDAAVKADARPAFDKQLCKRRYIVERYFNPFKQQREVATRYDKTAESYQAAVTLVSLLMRARHSTTTPDRRSL